MCHEATATRAVAGRNEAVPAVVVQVPSMRHGSRVALRAVAFAVVMIGCGGGSDTQDFARYWADGAGWCEVEARCGSDDQGTCLARWPTAAETAAAVSGAGISKADIDRCETASRLLDTCVLPLSCDAFTSNISCTVEHMAFGTTCALVLSALDVYYMAHPRSVFTGPFNGSYQGGELGSFTGTLTSDGTITASIRSNAGATMMGTGTVKLSGALALSWFLSDGTTPLTLTGFLHGKPTAFSGDGTWTGGVETGSWALTSGN